jgi:hypothetical protein
MVKAAVAAGAAGADDLQLMQVIVSLTDAQCGLHKIAPQRPHFTLRSFTLSASAT